MDGYIGNEQFSINENNISLTVNDYWRWAYSDFTNVSSRSALAEYIVASSLDSSSSVIKRIDAGHKEYDFLTKDGFRVTVKSAAYIQSADAEQPDCISFNVNCAGFQKETKRQSSCDIYVFCIYKAMKAEESPLNLDLWEFYVLQSKILDEKKPAQKTITLPSLMQLEPIWCDYYGIGEAIRTTMNA